jgi:protein TonB
VQPQTQLKVNVPKTTNNSSTTTNEQQYNVKTGSETGVPKGKGTGPPVDATPAATAKPACANPNQEATVTNPMSPDYPDSARDLGLGPVIVLVEVTIGPSGALVDATVSQKSGNMAIDQAALRAARQSQYSPKLVNCVPTTGSYIFKADFDPN